MPTFRIVGTNHRLIADQVRAAGLEDDEVLTLVPEPTNRFDPHAIKVMTEDGHHIGYVPRTQTDAIRPLLDTHEFFFDSDSSAVHARPAE